MQQTRIKAVVLLSLIGFFLGIVAISFHHHNNAFLLPVCSICKVKTSLSVTCNKIKLDTTTTAASLCSLSTAIFLCLSGIRPG